MATVLVGAAIVVVGSASAYLTDGQAPYGDDNSAHFALMMHIAELWRGGVTDLWWNQSNLGLPLFMAYQPLPAIVSGTLAAPFSDLGVQLFIFKFSIVGLWAAMPVAWYVGGRWLGLDRATALLFGLLTLAVHDFHHVGFGFTAATYGGLYTQIWGMFFLPLAIGAFRRFVIDRDVSLVVPVFFFVLISMSHLFCGMFAGIATLVWVAVSGGRYWERSRRALAVYLPALALLSFWLGPLIATSDLVGGLPWPNQYHNGWPVAELFSRLFGGEVFDHGRIPWLTGLAGAGVVVTLLGRGGRVERWLLVLAAVSLVLFMGRTNFGGWYNLLPMHEDINVMRYMNAVHFCGVLFAAKAASRLVGWGEQLLVESRLGSHRSLAVGLCALVVGGTYAVDRYGSFRETYKTFNQDNPNNRALVDHLAEEPGERFAVSEPLHTSAHFYRDLIPALAGRPQLQSYALGYHATLSTYYADYIDYNSEAWARLFNVGAFVAREPFEEERVAGLRETFEQGPYRVYESAAGADTGYFDFVRTPATVAGDYRAIRRGVRSLLEPGFERRVLPVLAGPTDASRQAGAPLLQFDDGGRHRWKSEDVSVWVDALREETASRPIESEVVASEHGPNWFRAEVDATGEGERLLLKVNYFPFWSATVDGRPVAIDHVAPNYMAVDVPQGSHEVRFEYSNPWWQKLGALSMLLILGSWCLFRWRVNRR